MVWWFIYFKKMQKKKQCTCSFLLFAAVHPLMVFRPALACLMWLAYTRSRRTQCCGRWHRRMLGPCFPSLSWAGPTMAGGSPCPCEHRMEPQCLWLFKAPGKFYEENHISFLQKGSADDYSLYPPLPSWLKSCCISLVKTELVGNMMFKMTVGTYCSSCITL